MEPKQRIDADIDAMSDAEAREALFRVFMNEEAIRLRKTFHLVLPPAEDEDVYGS